MRILDGSQMRDADRQVILEGGIPSIVLMENAGHEVTEAIVSSFNGLGSRRVAVLCGRGSNGGDGFVIARKLWQQGIKVQAFLMGHIADVQGDTRINMVILERLGLPIVEIHDNKDWKVQRIEVFRNDLVVDAVLGTGISRPLAGILKTVVADINESSVPVVAVDLPTGLSADTAEIIGEAIKADLTVTLGAPKLPLVLPPGNAYAGDLAVADIGIPESVINKLTGDRLELLTKAAIRRLLPSRSGDAHKGNFGHVLVVAGSQGKTGAACLAGLGALRSGAGLVTVATPLSCVSVVASVAPEYMTLPLRESKSGVVGVDALNQILEFSCDVIAIGPGFSTSPEATSVVRQVIEHSSIPIVLDADGLTVFTDNLGKLKRRKNSCLVITPHPGEMSRFCGSSIDAIQADRIEVSRSFARDHELYVVLKGSRTVIATPEGDVFINTTGNPGMASGGTGDVLTGMMAAWLGQLADPSSACQVSVYLHGLAGDLACACHGELSLIASDLIEFLGQAFIKTSDLGIDD